MIIKNSLPCLTDKIALQAEGSKFYNRNVTVFVIHDAKDSSTINDPATTFVLSSGKPASCGLNEQKVQTMILQIDNNDNPPLKVTNVTTSQNTQYLVAWLEKGKTYQLFAGNRSASEPQYDLYNFKDSIPTSVPTLSYGPLTRVAGAMPPAATPSKNYWLWPTIIIAVIVLSFLTFKLMKDIKHSGD